ncbi:MAG: DNA polymerase III subunit epsilon [Bacteroidetes bacterium HGW-Bacteroidetes-1]|jgi:DNA polymerase-3 subunit epsilon|nr:MAG: DNA polymerase III subunit epsilon [Bacteroidetes bacterium HGW-Bacteroidetes-1]
MQLQLKRPIAFFDLETTGLSITSDRLIEISILKVHPDGKEEQKTWRVNPGIPIPPFSTKFHGIKDEDVKDAPPFKDIAKELSKFLSGCDLAGYNAIKFDVPVLMEEFLRCDTSFDISNRHVVDVQNIFMKMEPRTLKGAYRFFCNKELVDAHSAAADTFATYEILKAQLDRYQDAVYEDSTGNESKPVLNDIKALHDFSFHHRNADLAGQIIFNDQNQEVINFGKHKGKTIEEIFSKEPSYYDWMMKGDFPLFTKKLITTIKLRMFGKQVTLTNNKNQ